ncbi:receptor-type tyrosine-protein phosphatase epsilon-like isoform X2 [Ptychodera flava]|uniref:receptor-type tyrosine-protein phosphatase epsilon-like isoform X2 n=1 Tax=Ptychodera flava TaxID=63121 RepID=UPI00396A90C1
MQLEEASSRNGPIRCYEVVVFQLEFDAETNSLIRYTDEDPDDVFPVADVVDYGTANGKPGTAYVAVKLNGNDFKEYVQVGSESRTSCQGSDESSRKRRDTVVFGDSVYNGELEPETVYQAFVRAYVDNPNGGEPYYKSSPFIEPVRTTSAPPTAAIAAISVVVIILIIAIIILTVLLVRRMKKRNERGKGSNKSGMRMRSFSQMGKMNNGFNVQEETVHSYPAIPNESLPQVYAEKHANDNALFKEEYDDLPRSSRPVTVEASNKPENKPKNRYINIHAYDQSRVKLSILDDDEDTDYINACYVDGYKTSDKFIAAQGPKEDTVDDFWRMVWEKKTLTIVMVTKCSENGREKCAQYWPDSGTEEYGEIEVTFEEVTALADYHIRIFSVCHLSDENEKRKITQLHYTSWPDFGVPGSPIGMLNFIKRARVINPARAGPMVVHCSAGVGRTGTFIVLDAMMDMMAAEGKADVFGFVSKIRGQRNHLVQADVQYVFIHQALAEHHLYGNTEIDVGNLLIHWQKLSKKVPNSDVTGLEDEYNKLINTAVENVVIAEANEDANRSKNRVANTVPYEANRFKLIRLIGKEHSDYVNASSIDGYRQKGAYIAAQGPLPNTLEDFWRLIWESRTGSIVMLTNLVERGQPKCELYWPQEEKEDEDEEQPTMYGNFAVIKKKEEDYTAYTIQEFFVTDTKGGETRTIRHFHYTEWPEVGAPERGTGLIEMMGQIQKQQQQTGNKPILVHCSTGGGRTGVFCVLSTVIERIKAEGIVDIFQTYKVLRQQRPNIIQSIDQYHFVYRAVLDYLDSFDSYDNFK